MIEILTYVNVAETLNNPYTVLDESDTFDLLCMYEGKKINPSITISVGKDVDGVYLEKTVRDKKSHTEKRYGDSGNLQTIFLQMLSTSNSV